MPFQMSLTDASVVKSYSLAYPSWLSPTMTRHDWCVPVNLRGVPTVLLPGTGSDDDYLARAFAPIQDESGALLITPAPQPTRLIDGYLQAMNDAARQRPIAVGGVSIGAAVAVSWALANPDRCVAVLAALPAWTGEPNGAPAAVSARHTAELLRKDGLAATTALMQRSSPAWLADELTRSWLNQWPGLPDAMEEACRYVSPNSAELAQLSSPLAVVAATDDPIHPAEVGREWVRAAPRAALQTISLNELGPNPSLLGHRCLAALALIG